jgi:glyoxylase-like metal-dependent hydrolase (beta-lactamase superfamily II)
VTTWTGGRVTTRAECVLAPNAGPMTLDGTNTWVLAEPAAERVVVVDPGPLDEAHLRRVHDVVRETGRSVGLVLLTGAPLRAARPGESVSLNGLELEIVATPGHTGDSVCFVLAADEVLLTGDTVLGRGTSVVAHPDGDLGDYLESLARLRDLAAERGLRCILPGHGPTLPDPVSVLDGYLAHRAERLGQVQAALAGGARTAPEVVEVVYADVDPLLWATAERTVQATLDYLERRRGA